MKRLTLLFFCFVFINLNINTAVSQNITFGTADRIKIIQQLPEMHAAEQQLDNFRSRQLETIQVLQNELEIEYSNANSPGVEIDDAQNSQIQQRIAELEQDIQSALAEANREFREMQGRLIEPIFSKIQKAIETVAEQMQIDVVINKSTFDGTAVILYRADHSIDITEKVIEYLDN
jgi:Skp family chaperone for outer membrane proteins